MRTDAAGSQAEVLGELYEVSSDAHAHQHCARARDERHDVRVELSLSHESHQHRHLSRARLSLPSQLQQRCAVLWLPFHEVGPPLDVKPEHESTAACWRAGAQLAAVARREIASGPAARPATAEP
eukprot:CAMPEP_0181369444 /NCGR_PEP_ID=MMETSP1106-20121128/12782_1 /TAXON_ID=81844 /ORGANISM="Mantoniella antarctica, Strain SL-175" /LENGTH=124 /DNA_ID=CAMNT_0023485943 /DNA_START=365 /DNA_END=738 /DNA_ORIENTATION=-